MARFRYHRDPLFLIGCTAYAVNRWLVKPHVHTGFFHDHFNDCWLIPCALPLVLWLHRKLGLRADDAPPRISEIGSHLILWSILFKGIAPRVFPQVTPDLWDIPCYWGGGIVAWLWWQREAGVAQAKHDLSMNPVRQMRVNNAPQYENKLLGQLVLRSPSPRPSPPGRGRIGSSVWAKMERLGSWVQCANFLRGSLSPALASIPWRRGSPAAKFRAVSRCVRRHEF